MDSTHRPSRRALTVMLCLLAGVLASAAGVLAQQYRLVQSGEPPLVGAAPVAPMRAC